MVVRHLSRSGYELFNKRVETPEDMRTALETGEWDIVLCDYAMPRFNALTALLLMKEMKLDIPFIVVSGTIGEQQAVEAMLAGAHDYFVKDNLTRLAAAIEREIQEAENRRARREAEAALRVSEDRYRDLVENSNDLICTHDLDGRVLSVNRAAAKILGFEPDFLTGHNIREILFSEFRAGFDDYIAEIQKNGIARGQMLVQTRAGQKRVWEYTNTLRTEGVDVPIVRGMAHDVTEREQALKALKTSETELRALFEAMTDVFVVVDAEGCLLKIAPTKTGQPCQPPEEAVGKTLHEIYSKKEADFFLEQVRACLSSNQTSKVEYSMQNGAELHWLEATVSPLSKDSVIWISHDITERKQAEVEQARLNGKLESQRKRLDNIIANIQGIVWETTRESDDNPNRLDFVSDYIVTMLGYSIEEWMSIPNFWLGIVHPEDQEKANRDVEAIHHSKKDGTIEFRWITKDGRVIWIESRIQVICDEEGNLVGMRGVNIDITERKQTERMLLESEERFKAQYKGIPVPTFSWRKTGDDFVLADYNDAAEKITKGKVVNVIGAKASEIFNETPEIIAEFNRCFDEKTVIQRQMPFRFKSTGELKYLDASSVFVPPDIVMVHTRDITEQKQIEEKLHFSEARLQKQNRVLTELTKHHTLFRGDFRSAIREITETSAQTLEVERVSVWLYSDDKTKIRAIDLYELSARQHTEGQELREADYPSYFKALATESAIVAGDAQSDARTSEFSESYLAPLGITSMLDTPIRKGGKVIGVVCNEHIGEPREWKLDEQNFAGSIADLVSLILEVNERQQTEDALRRSQQMYEQLVNSIEGIVWEADAVTFQFTFVSQYAERLTGYPVEHWLSEPDFWIKHIHPDDRSQAMEFCLSAIERKEDHAFDYRMVTADGREIWLRDIVTVEPGENESLQLRGVIVDITERRRAEEELRQSEKRYRLLFKNNPLPMWVYDVETLRFLAVNDTAIDDYGYSNDEFLSMTILDIRPPEDIPTLRDRLSEMNHELSMSTAWRHQRKDGSIFDVEITSHVLNFAGRNARLVLATDITERRQIEEIQVRRAAHIALRADISAALAESESTLRSLLEKCAEALVQHLDAAFARIWTFNKEENVLELQASAGISAQIDDTSARKPGDVEQIDLVPGEYQPHITNDLQNDPRISDKEWAEREGMVAFADYPLIVEDRLVGMMAIFARQKLAEDTLDAMYSIADIISQGIERKRAEGALRESEEQLRQSQKLEAIGQLAGGIAHDFNNLLTAINGYSDLTMRHLRAEDPLRRNIEEIKKAGDRAASLTRQLLAFSRKQVLQPKVLDLNTVVSDLEKMLRRLIGEDVDLRTVLKPQLGNVKADPGKIEQVIMNLALNARDAMPHGGKLIIETDNIYLDKKYADLHLTATPGYYVMLAVNDTGTGMDEQTQRRIFEPFFTTKEVGKGTGLGLSTVYGIIKQSGGNIWVYSEVGMGTSFKVYLPRIDEGAEDYKRAAQTAAVIQGTETILLAEDEDMVRRLACEVLEMYGYRVLEAPSGGSALLICEREQQIDLLVTDVVMPEMSGRELADRLALLRPEMKVLFMSGYTDSAITHQGILQEGENFIQKPFAPDDFVQKVREVLDSK